MELTSYIVRRICELKEQIEIEEEYIRREQEYIDLARERALETERQSVQIFVERGLSQEQAEKESLGIYDSIMNDLQEEYHGIEVAKERLLRLQNDLVIFENYGK